MSSSWVNRGVVGILLATFFSDVGHEMVTAVLPLYFASLGLGAAALGVMEGLADLVFNLSKLGGGIAGHVSERKRALGTLGYLVTTVASAAMALVSSVYALITLRVVAWSGRGFRGPLRDVVLADEVGPTHFGRAYGLERTADMLGAVVGPLCAALLVWLAFSVDTIIAISVIPAGISVLSFWMLTRDRGPGTPRAPGAPRPRLPRRYWLFVVGVMLFGFGDFSRTFLVFLAAGEVGDHGTGGALSTAVLLYAMHNLVSAFAAYPAGRLGDKIPKLQVLIVGYGLGVITNVMLAADGGLAPLVVAIALSGVYIAIEETVEKAVVAETLPRELRSLGLGILACANAVGDLGSSLYVGLLLDAGERTLAFALPAAFAALGTIWMLVMARKRRNA